MFYSKPTDKGKKKIQKMPDMLNWFGWCTWDAFYTDVTSEGVKEGLERYLLSSFSRHWFCSELSGKI
ncbi:hypothetical protein ACB092_11G096800 [Castanea dentata]